MIQATLPLDGYHPGPLFGPLRLTRPPVRLPGKEGVIHRAQTRRATPRWLNEEQKAATRAIYALATQKTAHFGELYVVDHIVPKISPYVCGLHVPWNLQVLRWLENLQKGNFWWPDGPFEQGTLF